MNGNGGMWELAPYYDFKETVVPLLATPTVVAEPDMRRFAIQFIGNEVGPVIPLLNNTARVSTRQALLVGESFQLAFGLSPYIHVSQYGIMPAERWYGISEVGILSITVVEILYKPRPLIVPSMGASNGNSTRPIKINPDNFRANSRV